MQPLKETKVYIPTDVNVELIPIGVKASVSFDDGENFQYEAVGKGFEAKELAYTHWLKEQTGYFLTKQEMEELLNDMSDWAKYFDEKIGIKYSHTELAYQKLKTEYINKLLNNE